MTEAGATRRLFLAVDITGSTRFKAGRQGSASESWLPIFEAFFTRLPLVLVGQLGRVFRSHHALPAIDIWKALGDALIFQCLDPAVADLPLLLETVLLTTDRYEKRYLAELPLRLKTTAWVADFPEPNVEIRIPELSMTEEGGQLDFLGPDIDLGFRLGAHARPDAVTVSIALRDLLLGQERILVEQDGTGSLAGVANGARYPILRARLAPD